MRGADDARARVPPPGTRSIAARPASRRRPERKRVSGRRCDEPGRERKLEDDMGGSPLFEWTSSFGAGGAARPQNADQNFSKLLKTDANGAFGFPPPARSVGEGTQPVTRLRHWCGSALRAALLAGWRGQARDVHLVAPSGAEFILAPAFGRTRGHHLPRAMHTLRQRLRGECAGEERTKKKSPDSRVSGFLFRTNGNGAGNARFTQFQLWSGNRPDSRPVVALR
jgi:hypothetical protein